MGGTLYIVGTPIGNLEDVTMRALRVLREVDLIAAEDTRRTARLLQHYSIATPTTSLHEHNERGKSPHLVAKLQSGLSIAVVSDAGMPLVNDPGAWLVREARAAGIAVQVVPGPSAVTAALAGAGVSGPFVFLGFPPSSGRDRKEWLTKIGHMTTETSAVFFEAPHRMVRTMVDLETVIGERPIHVAREVTKVFESLVKQPINEWLAEHAAGPTPKGEHVIIVPLAALGAPTRREFPGVEVLLSEFGDLTEKEGLKPRAAAKALAEKYDVTADEVYDLHAGQGE